MEIIRHLNDDQLEDMNLESDQQYLGEALSTLPGLARDSAHRPEEFWQRQRAAIWSRITPRPAHRVPAFPLLAWAALAAMVLLAAVALNSGTPAPAPQARRDPDHQLLMQVEQAMQNGGPEALEPAALLAQEIGEYSARDAARSNSKETNHEN